ncbi:MAG: uncharacterized protein QOH98_1644 [Methylobacteriaceae bacterium]|nr:uncharacterized protein [Methylobacteriaceae bacterium]
MADVTRPVPKPDVYVPTKPFWEGARAGRLMLQFCTDTGRFQHYPRPVSIYTGSRNLEWREVSGNGRIYDCTIVRIPGPGVEGRLPLSVATVELDEGVRIISNIIGSNPDEVAIGRRVVLAWDRLDDETPYPAFRLA